MKTAQQTRERIEESRLLLEANEAPPTIADMFVPLKKPEGT
ncbi:hypothetical protein [Roseomonas sp. WA12]